MLKQPSQPIETSPTQKEISISCKENHNLELLSKYFQKIRSKMTQRQKKSPSLKLES